MKLYDTTLRDGTQMEGMSLSVEDKLKIARLLSDFGIPYIEGGWPGSNPKDTEFFQRARDLPVVAFGMTRKAGLRSLLEAETKAVALVGKSSIFHVKRILGKTPEENLALIRESVRFMKEHGREVIYDAEHFFDGYREDTAYALATLEAASEADWIVLCDTNGGSLPSWVRDAVRHVRRKVSSLIGVHTHNDAELAVANALAAAEAGCSMIQGTINGYGERCGNANLVSLLPTLQLKMGLGCVPDLRKLTELSRTVSEIANRTPNPNAPYVGASAFAHKGGIHVAAVEKEAASYEHVDPEVVGNRRRVVVSELAGKGSVRMRSSEAGLDVNEESVLQEVKSLEHRGYQFEAAEGSFELLMRRHASYDRPFEVLDAVVTAERRNGNGMLAEATVKVKVGETVMHVAAEGDGPVHALDRALRKALLPRFPTVGAVRLVDYKVRILDPESATGATTRVLIEAAEGADRWSTVGCSRNIIEASCQALSDSLELHLARRSKP